MGQTTSSLPHGSAEEQDQVRAPQQSAGSSSVANVQHRIRRGRREDDAVAGSASLGGGGPQRRRNATPRYSPYTNPVPSTTPAATAQSTRQTTVLTQNIGPQVDEDEEMAELRGNAARLVEAMMPLVDALPPSQQRSVSGTVDTEEHNDVEMTDTEGGPASRSQSTAPEGEPNHRPRRQGRTQGGDLILARIIGRSIVDAAARELEERGTALASIGSPQRMEEALRNAGNTENSTNFFNVLPSAAAAATNTPTSQQQSAAAQEPVVPMYSMGFSGRVALYRDVARFILSILVSELGSANADNGANTAANANDQNRSNFGSSIPLHIQNGPMPTAATQSDATQSDATSPSEVSGNTASGTAGAQETTQTSNTTPSQPSQQGAQQNVEEHSRNTRMHYRMFLLPDAIDQTLEHYERYRRSQEQSNDTPAAEAEPGDEASNGDSNTSGGSSRTISSPIIESLNSVMNRIDSETQQALEAAPLEQPTDNSSTATRSSRNELIRRMRQREREEKLQRLRSMVRALSDERRFLPVPVVILGMHMSGELYHAISSGFNARVSASGSSGASGPETSTRTNSTSADAASAAAAGHEDFGGSNSSTAGASDERSGGTEGIFRGIRTRAGRLVPSIFDTIAAWRNGRGDSEATAAAAGNEDVGGGSDGSSRIPNVSSTTAAEAQQTSSSSDDGPMISAYLTIQYTQLGNPLLLHIIASTLLSDMLGETGASQSSTSASGNDYEILTELSNIIGQVMSNTVSQDLVNKKLAKYRFEGIIGGGEAGDDDNRDAGSIARLIGSEDNEKDGLQHPSTVKLLSSHRCPVCLEDFKVGETLRVLGCRHALHLACGDSWFTQGSNMCPVCRAEAVSTAPQKTN